MTALRRRVVLVVSVACVLALGVGCSPTPYSAKKKGDVPALIAMAEDTEANMFRVRTPAVMALGDLATPEAVDTLLGWAEDGAPAGLEDDVLEALGRTGDPRAVDPLLAALDSIDRDKSEADIDSEQQVRLWRVIVALKNMPDPRVADALLAELDAGHSEVIQDGNLSNALAGQGVAIAPELEKRLANADSKVYDPAAMALCSIYREAGKQDRVAELLKDKKTFRIYAGVIPGYITVDEQLVIDSLGSMNDVTMASRMLNSGSAAYEEAAKTWATKNGYTIQTLITAP